MAWEGRIILKVFNIDSYRFWVTDSEYDLSFDLRLIFKVSARSKIKIPKLEVDLFSTILILILIDLGR